VCCLGCCLKVTEFSEPVTAVWNGLQALFSISWFLSRLRLFWRLHYVSVTGIVLQKSCHIFLLSPHTDESYLFKMLACQGSLYGKLNAYCGKLMFAVSLCVLLECRQFRIVKHINKYLCFINVATCFRFLLSHYHAAVKNMEDFKILKSSKTWTENSNLCWYCL
jgi:hypothetical protein